MMEQAKLEHDMQQVLQSVHDAGMEQEWIQIHMEAINLLAHLEFAQPMNKAQRNYDVYNKELLGLREMFRHWQQYLHQAAHKVKVHMDHTNLLFWKNPGDHNRCVAQWHAELMEYDFKLVH